DAEQSFLNHYFGAEVVRLPYHYNMNLAIKRRQPALWVGTLPEQRIVHFTLVKPFIGRGPMYKEVAFEDLEAFVPQIALEDGGLYKPEFEWWGEVFGEMKAMYKERLAVCGAEARVPPS
ncbi:hypothetical protein EIP91_011035, partial [Steccherinum ochraceum]